MERLDFDWSTQLTCQFSNEMLCDDSLDRAEQASYLTDYLSIYKNSSYVLNINSGWGTGKTYFLKRWANSLKDKHPVIYFDAWSNDFHNEPLTLILGEIVEQLKALIKGSERQKKIDNLLRQSGEVLKATAPELAKGIVKKLVNVDVSEIASKLDDQENEAITANTISASTKALLSLHKKQQSSITELKQNIESTLSDVIGSDNSDGKNRWSPLYIFIDELDRCRPTFAIELLEVVKHIFSMERVIFVVATDTSQLQHSIKAIYGQEFDSRRYLGRFFDRSFKLAQPSLEAFITHIPSSEIIIQRVLLTNEVKIVEWEQNSAIKFVAGIFEGFLIDLRSATQILDRVSSILVHRDDISPIWLLALESIRVFNQESFEALVSGRIAKSTGDHFEYFFNQLTAQSKNPKWPDQDLIKPELSADWNNSPFKYVRVNQGRTQLRRVREIDYGILSIRKLVMFLIDAYSSKPKDYETTDNADLFELYLWHVKGNVQKYLKCVEVASRLS